MPRTDDPTCRAFQDAMARIASGFVHEINNKLGPILLNADTLAMSVPASKGIAAEISRNALELMEMMRDLEGVLPGNVENGGPFEATMRRLGRIAHGALRRRRLRAVFPHLDKNCLLDTDPSTTVRAMALVPFVYEGPHAGGPGTLRLSYAGEDGRWRWRIEVDPPSRSDEDVLRALGEICGCEGWSLSTGHGWFEIADAEEVTNGC